MEAVTYISLGLMKSSCLKIMAKRKSMLRSKKQRIASAPCPGSPCEQRKTVQAKSWPVMVVSTVEQASVSMRNPVRPNVIARKFPEDNCGNKMFENQKQLPNPQKSRALYSVAYTSKGEGGLHLVVEHSENCQGL